MGRVDGPERLTLLAEAGQAMLACRQCWRLCRGAVRFRFEPGLLMGQSSKVSVLPGARCPMPDSRCPMPVTGEGCMSLATDAIGSSLDNISQRIGAITAGAHLVSLSPCCSPSSCAGRLQVAVRGRHARVALPETRPPRADEHSLASVGLGRSRRHSFGFGDPGPTARVGEPYRAGGRRGESALSAKN